MITWIKKIFFEKTTRFSGIWLTGWFFFLLSSCSPPEEHYTVIVSLDGFRWDYPQIYNTPTLNLMKREGVSAIMTPSFPSATYPNHYAMATGLYPDHNGIINNVFWDKSDLCSYNMKDSTTRNNPRYYLGDPIWSTAKRQGLRTACLYWIGSDVPIKNSYPDYHLNWMERPHMPFEKRIEKVLSLLRMPSKQRPRLIMLYLEEPDDKGHHYGPYSKEVAQSVHYVDSLTGVLWKGIKQLPFGHKINFIVLSDHGMTEIKRDKIIYLDDYVKEEWIEKAAGHTPTSIYTHNHFRDSVYEALKKAPHLYVWKKEAIPSSLHYGENPYIGDILAVPELGWRLSETFRPYNLKGKKTIVDNLALKLKGEHGYFPWLKDMQVVFRACGPDFKQNYQAQKFENVNIYYLLCHLLNIDASPNDGNLKKIENMLAE